MNVDVGGYCSSIVLAAAIFWEHSGVHLSVMTCPALSVSRHRLYHSHSQYEASGATVAPSLKGNNLKLCKCEYFGGDRG